MHNLEIGGYMELHSDFNKSFPKINVQTPTNYNNFNNISINNGPQKDTFKKNFAEKQGTQNPNATAKIPSTYENIKSKWFTKENLIIGGAGLALSGTIATIAIIRGKNAQKALNGVKEQLSNNQKIVNELNQQLTNSQKHTSELQEQINKLTELPNDLLEAKNTAIMNYQKQFSDPKLNYDPVNVAFERDSSSMPKWYSKIFNFNEIKPLTASDDTHDIIKTSSLKKILDNQGELEINLSKTNRVKPELSTTASINENTKYLGKKTSTNITLQYGRNTNWSEQKIARDILQNFYDGHGHTLDGVNIIVKKMPSGEFNIKISGDATYEHKNLTLLGAGEKNQDSYNAGGFGEGTKILVANLLGQGHTKSVKYSCSNWNLTFDSQGDEIYSLLEKAQTPMNGNSIEFTTSSKKIAESVIDAINYFEHSKNPDFQNLHYNSPNFAFKFLDKNEKGNIYLQQRYEYNDDGKWDDNVDNLRIIFKRKPDPKKYEELIREAFTSNRDRIKLGYKEVYNLTRYFANEMSDEELAQTLITTKPMWRKLTSYRDQKNNALYNFIKGIIDTMYEKNIAINFGDEKLAAYDFSCNDIVRDALTNYNYQICPEIFSKIGMPEATKAFNNLSHHFALNPTSKEIKKFKILEEGIKIIKSEIDVAFEKHTENPVFKFVSNLTAKEFTNKIYSLNTIPEIEKIISKYGNTSYDINNLSNSKFASLKGEVEEEMKKILKNNPNEDTLKTFYELCYQENFFDGLTKEYLTTYKTLKLISPEDVSKPRYIFDRHSEIASDTLGEALVSNGKYHGHWVDREYLKNADFNRILGTWLHEICHKSGGDGSSSFTYTLTDMIRVLLNTFTKSTNKNNKIKLAALEEIYNKL